VVISLPELFQALNEKYFAGTLPAIGLHWNSRLRSSAGRFFPGSRKWFKEYPPKIEIASYLLTLEDAEKHIRDTLAHELVHYWLWVRRRPYGHTAEFKVKLKEVGATRYNPVPQVRPPKYLYTCPSCEKEFSARRRLKGLACRACCKTHAGGKFDERFRLVLTTEFKPVKRSTSKSSPARSDLPRSID
jgi:predicted SprT family Zn-dependent metalloprotease